MSDARTGSRPLHENHESPLPWNMCHWKRDEGATMLTPTAIDIFDVKLIADYPVVLVACSRGLVCSLEKCASSQIIWRVVCIYVDDEPYYSLLIEQTCAVKLVIYKLVASSFLLSRDGRVQGDNGSSAVSVVKTQLGVAFSWAHLEACHPNWSTDFHCFSFFIFKIRVFQSL
jgi:hypothetical protein